MAEGLDDDGLDAIVRDGVRQDQADRAGLEEALPALGQIGGHVDGTATGTGTEQERAGEVEIGRGGLERVVLFG